MLQKLAAYRQVVRSNLTPQMDAVIMTSFPQYKLHDLEAMNKDDYLQLYALAEWSIQELRGIPLVIDSPNNHPQRPHPKRPMPPGAHIPRS